MAQRTTCNPLTILIALAAIFAASCSTGPAPPEKGTPAFYWQAAKENFAAGDFLKTADQLEQIGRTKNEFTERAFPWRLILSSGLARGYMDLAEQFEYGGRANKQNAAPFRRMLTQYRGLAQRYSLNFAETFEEFEKTNPGAEIVLAFSAPSKGMLAPIPQLSQVATGRMIGEAELESVQLSDLQKSVLFVTTRTVGAENDSAKTREMMKTADAKVPKATFFLAMATSMVELSDLFNERKLDMPERQKFLLTHASDALKDLPESKEVKALKEQIEKNLKAMPKRG